MLGLCIIYLRTNPTSASCIDEGDELVLVLERHNSVTTSYVLLVDVDVRDSRLAALLSKIVLDLAAIGGFVELFDVDLVLYVGEV